jgi:hypothetical protein
MKKFLLIFTVLLFVFAFSGQFAKAAALTGVVYGPSGSTVGTYVQASSIVAMFTTSTAVTAGSTIVLDIPNNSVINPTAGVTVASDFTIQELGAGSAPTAPSVLAYDQEAHTITLTVDAASLSSDTAGVGSFVVKTSSTSGGNEIRNPQVATASGAFTVTTSVGDTATISDVTFIVGAASKLAFTTQPTNTAVAGVAIATQPIVKVQDTYGNTIASDSASVVTLTSFSDAACTTAKAGASGTLTKTAVAGVADFAGQGVTSTLVGATYFKAISGSLTSACSEIVTITVAGAHHLNFSVQPVATAYTYTLFSTQPTVVVVDQYDNTTADADVVTLLVDATDNTCAAAAVNANFVGDNTKAAGAAFDDLKFNAIDTSGIYLCAAATVGATPVAGVSNKITVYANSSPTVSVGGTTTATTTTTAPAATTTTTTSAAVTAMPLPVKPIAEMTPAEKTTYTMTLQQFLIQLLVQLLNLIKAQKGL